MKGSIVKRIIVALLVVASIMAVSTPADAAGCGKGKISCRSTVWYNLTH